MLIELQLETTTNNKTKHNNKNTPPGGGGDSHIKRAGVLIGNPSEILRSCLVGAA